MVWLDTVSKHNNKSNMRAEETIKQLCYSIQMRHA